MSVETVAGTVTGVTTTGKSLLETAKARFTRAMAEESINRSRALDALWFRDLNQWPEQIKHARENDPDSPRPCLVVDKINQYIRQVSNDERQNRPAIQVRPVDSGADVETAKIFNGIIRHIEQQANCPADIAYDTALEQAVDGGYGYFRVIADYVDENSFDQDLFIKRIRNRFSVYMGPHQMPEASDATWCFITDRVPKDEYQSLTQDEWPTGIGDSMKDWYDENEARIAEYFYIETVESKILLLENGQVISAKKWEATDPDSPDFTPEIWLPDSSGFRRMTALKERMAKVRKVKWCKMTGSKVLKEQDWAGKYIPVVKVTGNELDIEGKIYTSGLTRPLMDSQRMNNYGASAFVESVMLAPKSPWVGADGQIEDYETDWAAANRKNIAYLKYKPLSIDGHQVPPPQRQYPPGIPAGWISMMQTFEAQMEPASGIYRAALGAPSQDRSGVAIQRRAQESDTGTFHFIDNLSRAIRHLGVILVDLIPKYHDTAKVARILGEDGTADKAEIDPSQQMASREIRDNTGAIKRIYNLGVGRYDVTVTTGPSFTTKRQESAQNMMQMVQAYPQIMQIAGDLIFKAQDWPGAEQIAERLQKMMPPQLQESEDGQEQQAQQMIAQLQQRLQQAAMALEQLQKQKVDETQHKAAELKLKQMELGLKQQELQVKQFEAETDRMRVAQEAKNEREEGFREGAEAVLDSPV